MVSLAPDPSLKDSRHPNPFAVGSSVNQGPACSLSSRLWVLPGFPFSLKLLHTQAAPLTSPTTARALLAVPLHMLSSGRLGVLLLAEVEAALLMPLAWTLELVTSAMLLAFSFHPSLSLASAGRRCTCYVDSCPGLEPCGTCGFVLRLCQR